MIEMVLLLLVLAASVAALPRSERAAGTAAVLSGLVTAVVLASTEGGFALAPYRWVLAIALALAIFGYVLGDIHADAEGHDWEVR